MVVARDGILFDDIIFFIRISFIVFNNSDTLYLTVSVFPFLHVNVLCC